MLANVTDFCYICISNSNTKAMDERQLSSSDYIAQHIRFQKAKARFMGAGYYRPPQSDRRVFFGISMTPFGWLIFLMLFSYLLPVIILIRYSPVILKGFIAMIKKISIWIYKGIRLLVRGLIKLSVFTWKQEKPLFNRDPYRNLPKLNYDD